MDFEPCFKVYNFVSVYPKRIKLGKMTTLCGGVSLSIGRNLKLAPVPFAISEWPMANDIMTKPFLLQFVNCY